MQRKGGAAPDRLAVHEFVDLLVPSRSGAAGRCLEPAENAIRMRVQWVIVSRRSLGAGIPISRGVAMNARRSTFAAARALGVLMAGAAASAIGIVAAPAPLRAQAAQPQAAATVPTFTKDVA